MSQDEKDAFQSCNEEFHRLYETPQFQRYEMHYGQINLAKWLELTLKDNLHHKF